MPVAATPIVVGLGELLWDVFADSRRPGGAPANVAFHANQFGCRGLICSRVGRDKLGDEICDDLRKQGLKTRYIQRDAERPTGSVTVDTSDVDHPHFEIHTDVAWDFLEFDDYLSDLMSHAAAVCFGTLAQRSAQTRDTIHRCLEAVPPDCQIVYDVNLRQQWYKRDWIEASLRRAETVKLNQDEAALLLPLLELNATDPVEFARELRERFDIDLVCITRGDRGCLLMGGEEMVDAAGVKVDVVDAVGAGDAFTAALIVGQLKRLPLSEVARLANGTGALVAARRGAMPQLAKEFGELQQ